MTASTAAVRYASATSVVVGDSPAAIAVSAGPENTTKPAKTQGQVRHFFCFSLSSATSDSDDESTIASMSPLSMAVSFSDVVGAGCGESGAAGRAVIPAAGNVAR